MKKMDLAKGSIARLLLEYADNLNLIHADILLKFMLVPDSKATSMLVIDFGDSLCWWPMIGSATKILKLSPSSGHWHNIVTKNNLI